MIWDEAQHRATIRYRASRAGEDGQPRQRRRREMDRPTVEEAWEAVEESARHADPSRRLTWLDLAQRLSRAAGEVVTVRSAQHQLGARLGFAFGGTPRALAQAPCVVCGDTVSAADLQLRTCPLCR
jgi:hypothetical protein